MLQFLVRCSVKQIDRSNVCCVVLEAVAVRAHVGGVGYALRYSRSLRSLVGWCWLMSSL